MSILISRNTGILGSGPKVQIKINGKKVTSIKEDSTLEIEIPDDKANLKVTQSGLKSDEVEVIDGDIISIKFKKWYKIFSIVIVISVILSIFASILSTKVAIVFFMLWLLMIIISFLTNPLYINILNRNI